MKIKTISKMLSLGIIFSICGGCPHHPSPRKCNGDPVVAQHVCPRDGHGPCPFCGYDE